MWGLRLGKYRKHWNGVSFGKRSFFSAIEWNFIRLTKRTIFYIGGGCRYTQLTSINYINRIWVCVVHCTSMLVGLNCALNMLKQRSFVGDHELCKTPIFGRCKSYSYLVLLLVTMSCVRPPSLAGVKVILIRVFFICFICMLGEVYEPGPVPLQFYIYIYIYIHIYTHTYIYIYTHTNIYIYIFVYIYI